MASAFSLDLEGDVEGPAAQSCRPFVHERICTFDPMPSVERCVLTLAEPPG